MTHAPIQVIRHVSFEDLGTMERLFASWGLTFDYLDPPCDELAHATDARLLVVMGGPISVNDVDRFGYLGDEVKLIRKRIELGLPTLGICLGAQLIARALGATVAPMRDPEIGWAPLTLTAAGAAGPLRYLRSPVLHWHGEAFELPNGCSSLASTPRCPNQAFAVGNHTLALQFHIEVAEVQMERWLVGHIHELDHVGIPVAKLREDSRKYAAEATAEGADLLTNWWSGMVEG
ncbi:MAG: glutamine amidotransferase [Gammaproteobacteria bacterium]|nr:glutamine amidotransferase [Gammaproteobacteria bacterium]